MISHVLRRYISRIILIIPFIVITVEYFTGEPTLGIMVNELSTWAAIMVAFGLTVALFGMIYRNTRKIIAKQPGEWYYSAIFLAVLFIQLFFGLIYGTNNYYYSNIWKSINIAAYGAMSASTALYILSAGHRVFRIRTKESLILIATSIIVIVGNTSLGEAIWTGFPEIRNWIWDIPASAVMRGITIVTAVGLVSLVIRVISGMTSTMGEESMRIGDEE